MNDARRVSTLAVFAGLLIAGCGEPVPAGVAGPEVPAPAPLLSGAMGLLQCAPLSAESVTRVVGPAGGTVPIGPHRLVVPPGALTGQVAITAITRSESARRIRFAPTGLTFAEPATLTMSYADCGVTGLLPVRIAYTSSALAILDYLPSLTDLSARQVSARVRHFSNYAVAW